ncbi:MAG: hypothetical protein ABJN65_01000 [Parasphingorhabdus sp.]
MKYLFLTFMFFSFAGFANAAVETGPTQSPLKVAGLYQTTGNAVYIAFNTGSMPNCYNNSGGYLFNSHPNFDQIYAQVLTIMATGGIHGRVIFDTINPGAGQWSDCNILGFYLLPE